MSCFFVTYIVIHSENEKYLKKVFDILSSVFVFKHICIKKYLYLNPSRVFVFKYISKYLTPCVLQATSLMRQMYECKWHFILPNVVDVIMWFNCVYVNKTGLGDPHHNLVEFDMWTLPKVTIVFTLLHCTFVYLPKYFRYNISCLFARPGDLTTILK